MRTCRSTHLLELSLLAVFIGGNESSRERKFQGAKVPGSESSTPELLLPGANGLGSEKSIIQSGHGYKAGLPEYHGLHRSYREKDCRSLES